MNILIALPIFLVLITIVGTLVQGLVYLAKDDREDRKQMVQTLTIRISLSFVLFALLIIAYLVGWIQPNSPIM